MLQILCLSLIAATVGVAPVANVQSSHALSAGKHDRNSTSQHPITKGPSAALGKTQLSSVHKVEPADSTNGALRGGGKHLIGSSDGEKIDGAISASNLVKVASKSAPKHRYFTLHRAPAQPAGSMILLAPWGGEPGWWSEWLGKRWPIMIQGSLRVLECFGRVYEHSDADYRGWYGYENWHREIPVESELDEAVDFVHNLINQEYSILHDYNRIVVAGYSQGAVLALEQAFRYPMPLGLVVSMRGILLGSRMANNTAVASTTYIFTSGTWDDVYTTHYIEDCCRHSQNLGATTFMREILGLDHYTESERENNVLLSATHVVMSQKPPQSTQTIENWGDWVDCN